MIWWIRSEQPELANQDFAELGAALNKKFDITASQGRGGVRLGENIGETVELTRKALRLGQPFDRWLLIFDNAETPDAIKGLLVDNARGHALITTRNYSAWDAVASPLEIDVFTRPESVEHIRRRVPKLPEQDASRVAATLGDLPLAVEHAAAFLNNSGMDAATYLRTLERELTATRAEGRDSGFRREVAATWSISIDRLRGRSPSAERLLQLCAFFGPEPIALDLVYSDDMFEALEPYDPMLVEKSMLAQPMRELGRLALAKVTREEDTYKSSVQVHRLVQAVVRSEMSEEEQRDARHAVHRVLAAARPRQGNVEDPSSWPRYDQIWPHLAASGLAACGDPKTRELVLDRMRYLRIRGEFAVALELGEFATAEWTEALGPNHQQTLRMGFEIANVLRARSKYEEALRIDTKVLASMREALGDKHPYTLMTAGSLAADYLKLGRLRAAYDLNADVYAAFKEIYDDEHPRTLNAANNLALSLRILGRPAEARELNASTWELRKRTLGADSPWSLWSALNLARDLREGGDVIGAVARLRTTYDRAREVHGEDFPVALDAALELSVSLRRAGNLDEATRIGEEVLRRYESRLGDRSTQTLAARLNLASIAAARGDTQEALTRTRDLLTAYQKNLGNDRLDTLVCAHNLAIHLRETGDVRESRRLAQETVQKFGELVGEDHPTTLVATATLANSLAAEADFEQAKRMLTETRRRLAATLGPGHPETVACLADLAIVLHLAGRTADAEQARGEALSGLRQTLGWEHPGIATLNDWRRVSRELDPFAT